MNPLKPGDVLAYRGGCRSSLLLLFVLACAAVVGIDRYLTTGTVARYADAHEYNLRELAEIRATQDAQVVAGQSLRVTQVLANELESAAAQNKALVDLSQRLLKENLEMKQCLDSLKDIFTPAESPTPADEPAAVDKET